MIRVLEHKQIDKEKWDKAIQASNNGFIYALSWYLDVVSPGWKALVKGDYDEVMPLTYKKKFYFHYLFPPYSTQQLGVFSTQSRQAFDADDFINAIPAKFKWVDIRLNHFNILPGFTNNTGLLKNYELCLSEPYELLYKGFSENTKRNLKKAEKEGLKILTTQTAQNVARLFRENKGAALAKPLPESYYDTFFKIFEKCRERGLTEVYQAEKEGKAIAGVVFFRFKNRGILILTGANQQARESKAMFLILNHFIKLNAGTGTILDFEGSNIEDLARFYKGFGAKNVPYPSLKINKLPFWAAWAR